MIDEIEEVGVYTFQIRLMDENKQSRVTIPPVENGIEIKEPIAIEDDNTTNVVGLAKANYAVATSSDVDTPAFDDAGKYIKTNWNDGDIITNASLNKIEDGIYTTNGTSENYANAIRESAKKWGIPYLDEANGENVPLLNRTNKSYVCKKAKDLRDAQMKVGETNGHPNVKAHEYESTIVENFLRSL